MDDLTCKNSSVKEGGNLKKSFCIITGNSLIYGVTMDQLKLLYEKLKVFRKREKTLTKRLKGSKKHFWFSIQCDVSISKRDNSPRSFYCIFTPDGEMQMMSYYEMKVLSDALLFF